MLTMNDWVAAFLLLSGACFCLVAAIGLIRFGDLFLRIHAATKAGAFGGSLVALACGFHFGTLSGWLHTVLIIAFFYVTAPVAAHMLGRQEFLRMKRQNAAENVRDERKND